MSKCPSSNLFESPKLWPLPNAAAVAWRQMPRYPHVGVALLPACCCAPPADRKQLLLWMRPPMAMHVCPAGKAAAVLTESAEDVRFLARLWQLQNKMEAVGGAAAPVAAAAAAAAAGAGSSSGAAASSSGSGSGASSSGGPAASAYEARIGRVSRARANIEERLARKVELLDGYR